jgi:membrane protein DedA with SNARE-associated domain
MTGFIDGLLNVSPLVAYIAVFCLVFAEDAVFVGFVVPGETAAVLGGVVASRGEVQLGAMMALVVAAAIIGDSVGYEVGKHLGTRIMKARMLRRHAGRLENAQDFLRRKGGSAVFLGRFTAFFRAVMPALAGTSRMPYGRFLAYNAVGGMVWGIGFVLLGFLAGNSYEAVAQAVGRDLAVVIVIVAVAGLIVWHVRSRRRRDRRRAASRRQD